MKVSLKDYPDIISQIEDQLSRGKAVEIRIEHGTEIVLVQVKSQRIRLSVTPMNN